MIYAQPTAHREVMERSCGLPSRLWYVPTLQNGCICVHARRNTDHGCLSLDEDQAYRRRTPLRITASTSLTHRLDASPRPSSRCNWPGRNMHAREHCIIKASWFVAWQWRRCFALDSLAGSALARLSLTANLKLDAHSKQANWQLCIIRHSIERPSLHKRLCAPFATLPGYLSCPAWTSEN